MKLALSLLSFVILFFFTNLVFADHDANTKKVFPPKKIQASPEQVKKIRESIDKLLGQKAESITFRLFGHQVVIAREFQQHRIGEGMTRRVADGVSIYFEQSFGKYMHTDGSTYITWTLPIKGYKTVKEIKIDAEDSEFIIQVLSICSGVKEEPVGKEVAGIRLLTQLEIWLLLKRGGPSSDYTDNGTRMGNVKSGEIIPDLNLK